MKLLEKILEYFPEFMKPLTFVFHRQYEWTWLKIKVLNFLDKHTRYCRASLVFWMIGSQGWEDVSFHDQKCDYCGKESVR